MRERWLYLQGKAWGRCYSVEYQVANKMEKIVINLICAQFGALAWLTSFASPACLHGLPLKLSLLHQHGLAPGRRATPPLSHSGKACCPWQRAQVEGLCSVSIRYAFKYTHEQVPTTCQEDAVGSSFFSARGPQSRKALEQPVEQSQTEKGKVQGDMLLNVVLSLPCFTFPLKFCVQGPLREMRERRSQRVTRHAAHSARARCRSPLHPPQPGGGRMRSK